MLIESVICNVVVVKGSQVFHFKAERVVVFKRERREREGGGKLYFPYLSMFIYVFVYINIRV
jgi:hypothetical protein